MGQTNWPVVVLIAVLVAGTVAVYAFKAPAEIGTALVGLIGILIPSPVRLTRTRAPTTRRGDTDPVPADETVTKNLRVP